MTSPFVRVDGLTKYFSAGTPRGLGRGRLVVRAVEGVSFAIPAAQTLGLVGESGCGKSTVGRTVLRLVEPDAGRIMVDGVDVRALGRTELRRARRRMQIVFQDPYGSLNPRMTVRQTLSEPLAIHRLASRPERGRRVAALLEEVGLDPRLGSHFPHELSGGQRQRVGIARALSVEPTFLVLDEPVSALDVSVQAQVLNLLADLQRKRGLAYLFIAHDLATVKQVADHLAVMYLGRVVEAGPATLVFPTPRHPYTAALLSAVPRPIPARRHTRVLLSGEPPSSLAPPAGCPFHPRCPHPRKNERCRIEAPELHLVALDHVAACHFATEPIA